MNKRIKNFFKRYHVSRTTMWLTLGIAVLAMIVYLVLLYCVPEESHTPLWEVGVNLSLVMFSVVTSALISALLIETKSKNDLFHDIMCNEIISSPDFYSFLPEEKRLELLKGVECNLFFKNCEQKESMYNSVREKIENIFTVSDETEMAGCFFEQCKYDVKCTIKDDRIEKDICKTIDLRAYEKKTICAFPLCRNASEKNENLMPLKVTSLKVGNKSYNEQALNDPERSPITYIDAKQFGVYNEKSGYSESVKAIYNPRITASPNKKTIIELRYITQVPINDIASTFRLKVPCHKFSFSYKIRGEYAGNYRVNLRAFGFAETGESSPNRHDDEPEISILFDNWIFPQDGVAVTMLKKS